MSVGAQLQVQHGLGWPSPRGGQCESQPITPEVKLVSEPEQNPLTKEGGVVCLADGLACKPHIVPPSS